MLKFWDDFQPSYASATSSALPVLSLWVVLVTMYGIEGYFWIYVPFILEEQNSWSLVFKSFESCFLTTVIPNLYSSFRKQWHQAVSTGSISLTVLLLLVSWPALANSSMWGLSSFYLPPSEGIGSYKRCRNLICMKLRPLCPPVHFCIAFMYFWIHKV